MLHDFIYMVTDGSWKKLFKVQFHLIGETKNTHMKINMNSLKKYWIEIIKKRKKGGKPNSTNYNLFTKMKNYLK